MTDILVKDTDSIHPYSDADVGPCNYKSQETIRECQTRTYTLRGQE